MWCECVCVSTRECLSVKECVSVSVCVNVCPMLSVVGMSVGVLTTILLSVKTKDVHLNKPFFCLC